MHRIKHFFRFLPMTLSWSECFFFPLVPQAAECSLRTPFLTLAFDFSTKESSAGTTAAPTGLRLKRFGTVPLDFSGRCPVGLL